MQADILETHVADLARLLRAGGFLAVFNLSYRGLGHDRAAVRVWCNRFGFRLTCDGVKPFRLWDAAVFLMHRPTC